MSYCRWSDDAGRCDIYAYEEEGGFAIHVARRKRNVPPDAADISAIAVGEPGWFDRYEKLCAEISAFPFVDLTAPSAGQTFTEPTLEAFRERMLALRAEGLSFPDSVLAEIDAEIASLREPPR